MRHKCVCACVCVRLCCRLWDVPIFSTLISSSLISSLGVLSATPSFPLLVVSPLPTALSSLKQHTPNQCLTMHRESFSTRRRWQCARQTTAKSTLHNTNNSFYIKVCMSYLASVSIDRVTLSPVAALHSIKSMSYPFKSEGKYHQ